MVKCLTERFCYIIHLFHLVSLVLIQGYKGLQSWVDRAKPKLRLQSDLVYSEGIQEGRGCTGRADTNISGGITWQGVRGR